MLLRTHSPLTGQARKPPHLELDSARLVIWLARYLESTGPVCALAPRLGPACRSGDRDHSTRKLSSLRLRNDGSTVLLRQGYGLHSGFSFCSDDIGPGGFASTRRSSQAPSSLRQGHDASAFESRCLHDSTFLVSCCFTFFSGQTVTSVV
jgi:hypothetical protein